MPATVSAFGPDGQRYAIPSDQMDEFLRQGGDIAINMRGPDGHDYEIPSNKLSDALGQGMVPSLTKPVPDGLQANTPAATNYAGAALAAGDALRNAGIGAGKTALQPLAAGSIVNLPADSVARLQQSLRPLGTAQAVGGGIEQAGELVAGGGPLRAVSKGVGMLGRIGLGAGEMAVNAAAHGQDVTQAAAIGGLTAGGGQLAEKLAPKLAEAALATRYTERMYGRNPGATIINDTSGLTPETIAQNARSTSRQIVATLESKAGAAAAQGVTTSTRPALDIIDEAISKAVRENNAAELGALKEARQQLTQRLNPETAKYDGESIPVNLSPQDLLDLKRGLGDTITTWGRTPDRQGVSGVLKAAYHALDAEFDRAVPGAADLNQTVSTLIGIGRDAERRSLAPGILQNLVGRMRAPTGAMVGSAVGALEGSRDYGWKGGVVGGLAGLVAPEVMARPTAQMFAARAASGLGSPAVTNAAVPALVNALLNRGKQ